MIIFVYNHYFSNSQVKTLLQQAGLSNWEFIENDGILIREKLVNVLNQIKPNEKPIKRI